MAPGGRRARGDERLWGVWVPDPERPDAAYRASLEFTQRGVLRFTVLEPGGIRELHQRYRVDAEGWLAIKERGRAWEREAYRIGEDDALHFGTGRYIRASDPRDRPWPPELTGEPPPP